MVLIGNSKINAYIMALYIFQFGLLQPIASIVNSQLPIAIFTVILVILMLLNNKWRIKKYVIVSFIIISVCFLLNALISENNPTIVLGIYFEFLLKSFSAFLIASLDTEENELYNAFLKIGILNFVAIGLFPFTGFLDSMNYMRFGYAMVPSIMIFIFALIKKEKPKGIFFLLTLLSLSLTIVYGNRGPLVALILFGLLIFIFSKQIKLITKFILLSISCMIVTVIIKYDLLIKFLDYIYFDLGIKSYTLEKIRMMILVGISESSSGRESIYSTLWYYIDESPLIGWGVGFSQIILGGTAHNIILQILLESGLLGLIIWGILWLYCLYKYIKITKLNKIGLFSIATIIIASSIGRLLVSSDMWLRPEFWFALSLLLAYRGIEIKNKSFNYQPKNE